MLVKTPWVQCYQVLREAGCHGEDTGLTVSALEARCNERYGIRCTGYWNKQLRAEHLVKQGQHCSMSSDVVRSD